MVVVSLMEGEWSCYRGGLGGEWSCIQKWSRFNGGRSHVTAVEWREWLSRSRLSVLVEQEFNVTEVVSSIWRVNGHVTEVVTLMN